MSENTHYAAAVAPRERKGILRSLSEADLRRALVELLVRMLPSADTHLTHGPYEFGKDLVAVVERPYGLEAFALVVKAEKLTGESAGPVDDVLSQTREAFEIPAEVPTRLEPFPVSEVWIVVSDTISRPARERIEKQLPQRRVRFVDLDELDAWFVEHYPEVFFHGAMLTYLDETARTLESDNVMSPDSPIHLTDTFVDPYVVDSGVGSDDVAYDLELFGGERRIVFSRFAEVLSHNRCVLVVGEPGVGKSAALRKLGIDGVHAAASTLIANRGAGARIRIPLLVKARQLVDCPDAQMLCKGALPDDLPEGSVEVTSLLVDGLDETPSQLHGELLAKAQEVARELGASLVVTSRNIDTVRDGVPGFRQYQMLPFETAQALELFKKMVSDPQTLVDLEEALDEVSSSLALVPLSLVLLVQIAQGSEEIPATIGELYDRFTDEVLGRHDTAKGIEVLFDYQIKKRLLAALAFGQFYSRDRLEIPRADFDAYLEAYFRMYDYDLSRLNTLVRDLEGASILSVNDEHVSFKHRSFLEYFCAFQVLEEPETVPDLAAWIVDTYYDLNWSDVVFYYFGHRRRLPDAFLDELLAFERKDDLFVPFAKFMVGRLLQAGWHSPLPTRQRGIEGALHETKALREDFVKLASALHGNVPDVVADIALMTMADRSFKSGLLSTAGARVLDTLPLETVDDALGFVALLSALRHHLSEDELLSFGSRFEDAATAFGDKAVQARLLLMGGFVLEDVPAIKKRLEDKYSILRERYPDVIRGILPPPRKGWRRKKRLPKGRDAGNDE
jgi:hypothetical protein